MGRILMIEFDDRDTAVFDEIMRALEKHPSFEQFRLRDESTLSLPELDIFLQRRKAYSGYTEIPLTAKEFDILCMLAANKGIVLTYDQIYHRLWKEDTAGNVSNTVGCHVRSLRRKLHRTIADIKPYFSAFPCRNLRPNIAFLPFCHRLSTVLYNKIS